MHRHKDVACIDVTIGNAAVGGRIFFRFISVEFIFPKELFPIGRNWHLGFSRLPEGLKACLSPLLYKSIYKK